jgi:hypothetical protein
MTQSYALLSISVDAFVEIWGKLEAAGYHDQLHDEGDMFVLDMQGLALRAEESQPDGLSSLETPEVLPEHVLERIAWYAKQASQPPVHVIQVPDDTDPVGWCADALLRTVGQTVYGVSMGTREEIETRGALMTALTGNGLKSHANANFYVLCHTAVPMLIAEIRRLRAQQEAHG